MEIRLSQACLQQLLAARPVPDKCLRLSATQEGGGCSCMIAVLLRWDEDGKDDFCAETDGLCFVMDDTTRQLLDEPLYHLDYRRDLGYVVRSHQETVAYGVPLMG